MATLTIYSESEFKIIVTYTVNTNSADTYKVTATCSMQAKTPSWFSGTGTAKCGYSANQDYFYIGLGTSATNQQKAAFPVFSNKTLSTSSWTTLATTGSVVYTVTKTHAAQTLTFGVYKTSNTNYEDVTISDGGSYSESYKYLKNVTDKATLSVTARTSYNVAFNANSGSGAPATQTKWYNEALTLSSTRPTRAKYTFKNWNTAQGGTGTSYNPGGSYTANAAATLYAQWTWNHTAPKIESLKVVRCDASGNPDDEGTRCIVTATLKADTATETDAKIESVTIKVGGNSAETFQFTKAATVALSMVSSYTVAQNTRYTVAVTATDNKTLTTTKSVLLSPAFFTMDFWGGGADGTDSPGHGVAIGMPCTRSNLFDIGMPTRFNELATVQATTSSSTAYDSGNPKIRFSNANASQNGDLVFTDYDAIHAGATLAWITNQTQSWFHTQHIYTTGNVYSNSNHIIKDTTADTSSATNGVTSNTYKNYSVQDKNNKYASYLETTFKTDGSVNLALFARNFGTGANVDNGINLSVANNGTLGVSVSTKPGWRNALGASSGTWPVSVGGTGKTSGAFHSCTQLYNSTSGSNGTITLSASVVGYDYLAVWTIDNNSKNPQISWIATRKADTTSTVMMFEASSNTGTLFRRVKYTISAKTMTPIYGNYIQNTAPSSWTSGTAGTNYVKVTRVMGYII